MSTRSFNPAELPLGLSEPHPSTGNGLGLVKRALDVAGALAGLAALAPLFLVVWLVIKLDSPGPAFFKQKRVGLYGREFHIYKFRSMQIDAEARQSALLGLNQMEGPLFKLKDDPRITRVGRFLRRSSIDELPQLLNVLLGDMSLVGPRPPLPREVDAFEPWQKEKFLVRPGMTGLWQVSGRNELSAFEKMIALDIAYIRQWSPWLDLQILAKTLPVVLWGRGAH